MLACTAQHSTAQHTSALTTAQHRLHQHRHTGYSQCVRALCGASRGASLNVMYRDTHGDCGVSLGCSNCSVVEAHVCCAYWGSRESLAYSAWIEDVQKALGAVSAGCPLHYPFLYVQAGVAGTGWR
jgi:hypothetical protein